MGDARITGDIPSMQKSLLSDKEKRWRVLECFVLVHNFQTEVVCHNQILQCLHQSMSESLTYNINGYDRIHRYYLEPGDYKTNDEAELLEENFGNKGENEDA